MNFDPIFISLSDRSALVLIVTLIFVTTSGELLCRHMLKGGKTDEDVIHLCSILYSRHPEATWVYREIGGAQLRRRQWSKAVAPLLKAVKLDSRDALSWENLGISYYNLGRLASSKKALDRAIDLDRSRPYSNLILSWISTSIMASSHTRELRSEVESPLHFLSQAYKYFRESMHHIMRGALSTADPLLRLCSAHVEKCISMDGTICAALKLHGDVTFVQSKIYILVRIMNAEEIESSELWKNWEKDMLSVKRTYAKAIHLRPYESSLWSNMCLSLTTYKQENQDQNILASLETVDRCLRAGIRLQPESSKNWLSLGCFLLRHSPNLARYAFSRSLQLDNKNFSAWECISSVIDEKSLEMGFCQQQAQACKEDSLDVWSRIIASKCNAESDMYSRINVADIFGATIMDAFIETCLTEDAADGPAAFSATLTANCLDPLNTDLLMSLWIFGLRYGKFGICKRIYNAFHDQIQGTAAFPDVEKISESLSIGHPANEDMTALPIFTANDPEYAKKVLRVLHDKRIDVAMQPQLLFYMFESILTFYRAQPSMYTDSMHAIKSLLVYGATHIDTFVSTYNEALIARLNAFYEMIDEIEGKEVLLSKLETDACPFFGQHPDFLTLLESAKSIVGKIMMEKDKNSCSPDDQATDLSDRVAIIKKLHLYPWKILSQ